MPDFASLQIPPPSNWQDFERLCLDLFQALWHDPSAQPNGRQGQFQCGVDFCGHPDRGDTWIGVQCKCKDGILGSRLTKREVRKEVAKAKSFQPPLAEFILVTTGPTDAALQQMARELTVEHRRTGLFSVSIMGWDDIQNHIASHPAILAKHYPTRATPTRPGPIIDLLPDVESQGGSHGHDQIFKVQNISQEAAVGCRLAFRGEGYAWEPYGIPPSGWTLAPGTERPIRFSLLSMQTNVQKKSPVYESEIPDLHAVMEWKNADGQCFERRRRLVQKKVQSGIYYLLEVGEVIQS